MPSKVVADKNRIRQILDRGVVVNILPSKEAFVERLASGEKIRIYIGADPTSDSLHLSHAKNYMFLEELRELGHEVIVLFGDFTARIGDPTDRSAARKQLTEAEVKKNVAGWLKQIKPLMNFADKKNPPKIAYNSKWLAKLTFSDVVELASNFTVQQMLERDMFQKRIKEEAPIHLHEFMYPLMQGYDSVAMDVDAELCGTDQTFNALAGRTLMKRLRNKEKFVVVVNLMENPKTGELMSKSRGTGVFLSAPAEEMYGQIMSQPDEMIEVLLVNNTRISLGDVKDILNLGPRAAKARTALEIVSKFYGENKAAEAGAKWEKLFAQKDISGADVPALKTPRTVQAVQLVMLSGVVQSKSEARRLVIQSAVKVDKAVITNPAAELRFKGGEVLQIGKHRFFRLTVK